jgi:poly(hydroxyalkanoate) depolymerase family esterase
MKRRMQAGDSNHVYRGKDGAQRYQVHVPPRYDGVARLPVVMAVHGCGMTGYGWNSMKSMTQFNALADKEGFLVVYPTQRLFRNKLNCWNSLDPREQHRYRGEPALLAGVAREAVQTFGADPDQVHVVGASSGAGTAVILAVTYPDVFATVTSVAGGEYGFHQVDRDDPDATPPEYTARQAWAQMGTRARAVPLLVIQGADDTAVPPWMGRRLIAQWKTLHVLTSNDELTSETESKSAKPGRHAYARTTVSTPDGRSVVESYFVEGMGHSWSGPAAKGLFIDREGPDLASVTWDFARRHRR